MKKITLLTAVALLIFGCEKSEINYNGGGEPTTASLKVSVFKMKELSTGEEYKEKVLYLKDFIAWEAEDKNFEIKSIDDLEQGFAYDKNTKKSYKFFKKAPKASWRTTDYYTIVENRIESLKPGRYFVFIRVSGFIGLDGLSNSWSYTTIEIKPGDNKIEKVFPSSAKSYQYSPW